MTRRTLAELEQGTPFVRRHIGPDDAELGRIVAAIGVDSLEELADRAVPPSIRTAFADSLPPPATEAEALAELRVLAARNRLTVPMIGLGYHGTQTPPVIVRNVLENPAWYTAYTPYQPEISQGRLEALLNFQTVVSDLTGLATANASMLDEGTAAAEAMAMAYGARGKPGRETFFVSDACHPQTIDVVRTRAEARAKCRKRVGGARNWLATPWRPA